MGLLQLGGGDGHTHPGPLLEHPAAVGNDDQKHLVGRHLDAVQVEPDLPESGCNDDCRKIGHFCEEIRSLFEKFGQLEVDLAEEGVDLRLRCRSKSPRAKMIDVIAVRRGRGDSAGGGVGWMTNPSDSSAARSFLTVALDTERWAWSTMARELTGSPERMCSSTRARDLGPAIFKHLD